MTKLPDPKKSFSQQDEDVLLAMLGWGEARGEPVEALIAVVHVPITRAKIKKTSVSHECLREYAFSCFLANDKNSQKLLLPLKFGKSEEWDRCYRAAVDALQGLSQSPAKDATHYVVKSRWMRPTAANKKPKWFELLEVASGRTKKIAVIGGQVFAKCPF